MLTWNGQFSGLINEKHKTKAACDQPGTRHDVDKVKGQDGLNTKMPKKTFKNETDGTKYKFKY